MVTKKTGHMNGRIHEAELVDEERLQTKKTNYYFSIVGEEIEEMRGRWHLHADWILAGPVFDESPAEQHNVKSTLNAEMSPAMHDTQRMKREGCLSELTYNRALADLGSAVRRLCNCRRVNDAAWRYK